MKHLCRLLLLCAAGAALFAPPAASALPAEIVYAEGESRVRFGTGREAVPDIGEVLNTGDSVLTGLDGLVELDQEGVSIRVQPDTVFTLREREQDGKKVGILALVLGSIRFRYDKLTGREPGVQTNSFVAGVRGTEFTIYSGVDGSSLLVVDSGVVQVESAGVQLRVEPEEGVEVRPGEAPGEKFRMPSGTVDFSKWNNNKLNGMLEDPLTAMSRLRRMLHQYIEDAGEYSALYREHSERLALERAKVVSILEAEGREAAKKYGDEVVFPLSIQTGYIFLNLRYHALSALSMRRFVVGRLYMQLKTTYIADPTAGRYREFLREYQAFLSDFETSIVPSLVETDF